jgi:hypothetical protein
VSLMRASKLTTHLRRFVAATLVGAGLAVGGALAGVAAAPAGAQIVPVPPAVQSEIDSLEGDLVGTTCALWWESGIPESLHVAGATCLIGSIPDGGLL